MRAVGRAARSLRVAVAAAIVHLSEVVQLLLEVGAVAHSRCSSNALAMDCSANGTQTADGHCAAMSPTTLLATTVERITCQRLSILLRLGRSHIITRATVLYGKCMGPHTVDRAQRYILRE